LPPTSIGPSLTSKEKETIALTKTTDLFSTIVENFGHANLQIQTNLWMVLDQLFLARHKTLYK
jgi:hypothetical protein